MSKPKQFAKRLLIQIDQRTADELEAIREFRGIGAAEICRRALAVYLFKSRKSKRKRSK